MADSSKSGEGGGEDVFSGEGEGDGALGQATTPARARGRRERFRRPPGPRGGSRSPRSRSRADRSASPSPPGGRVGGIDLDPYEMPALDPWHSGRKPWTKEYLETVVGRLKDVLTDPEHLGLLEKIDPDNILNIPKTAEDSESNPAAGTWKSLLDHVDLYIKSSISYIELLGKVNQALTEEREELEGCKKELEIQRTKRGEAERWILGLEAEADKVQQNFDATVKEKTAHLEAQANRYPELASRGLQGPGGGRGGGVSRLVASESKQLEEFKLQLEEEVQRREEELYDRIAKLEEQLDKAKAGKNDLDKKYDRLKEHAQLIEKGYEEASRSGSSSRSTESPAVAELARQQSLYEVERKVSEEKIQDLTARLASNEEQLRKQETEAKKVFDEQLAKAREDHARELATLEAKHAAETGALTKQISDLQSGHPQELRDLTTQHNQETEQYKTQISDLSAELETSKVNQDNLSALVKALNTDLEEAKNTSSATATKLQSELAELTEKLAQVESEFEASKTRITELTNRIHQLESELEASNANNEDLTKKLAELQAALDASNASNNELMTNIAELTGDLEASNGSNNTFTAQIEKLTTDLETSNISNTDLTAQIAKFTTDLEASNTFNTDLTTQTAKLIADLEASNASNNKLATQIAELKGDLEASNGSNTELKDQVSRLESYLQESEASHGDLLKQLDEVKNDLETSKASGGEAESRLFEQLAQVRSELSMSKAMSEEEKSILREQLADVKAELDANRATNAEAESRLREQLAEVRAELEANKNKNNEEKSILLDRLNKASADLEAMNASKGEVESRLSEQLIQARAELESTRASSEEEKSSLLKQLNNATSDLKTANTSKGEAESRLLEQLAEVRAELENLRTSSEDEKSRLLEQLNRATADLETGTASRGEAESRLSEQLTAVRAELDATKTQWGRETSGLHDEIAQFRADVDENKATNAQLSERVAALESEIAQRIKERDAALEETKKVRDTLTRVQQQLGLEELEELIFRMPAALVPLPASTESAARSAGGRGSRIPRPIFGSKSAPAPKYPIMPRRTPDPRTAVRRPRRLSEESKSAESAASSAFVDEPQSAMPGGRKIAVTSYLSGLGYPNTMTQDEFDNEASLLDEEVAQLAPSKSAGEDEEQFRERIRRLQLRAEDLARYNSSNTTTNNLLAEATKALELLAGKIPDSYQDAELFDLLYTATDVLRDLEMKIEQAGLDEAKIKSAAAEAIPPLDSVLVKYKDKHDDAAHKAVSDLGTTLREWAAKPDTDKRPFTALEEILNQYWGRVGNLFVKHRKGYSIDARKVDEIQQYIEGLHQEAEALTEAAERYKTYKKEWGDKPLSDEHKVQLKNLAIELVKKGEWTRPSALQGLLAEAGDFLPGHADMARQRKSIKTPLDALWAEVGKLDENKWPFNAVIEELQKLIDNDQVLRNVERLEHHRDIIREKIEKCNGLRTDLEVNHLRSLQKLLDDEIREADERAQKALTDTLVEVNAELHKPEPPQTKDGEAQTVTQGTKTDASTQSDILPPPQTKDSEAQTVTQGTKTDASVQAKVPPPKPTAANRHLEGACFCTLFLYFFPNLYQSIIKGGCCSQGLMKTPNTEGSRAGTQPPSSSPSTTAETTKCKGHHGHGYLLASGDTYTLICNILTALVWFISLILYSPYDFGVYILSLILIPFSPFTLVLSYLKYFYAYVYFKLFEQGKEVPPNPSTLTNPRGHPRAKGPNNRPLYAASTRPEYPGIVIPAIPSPGRLVSFAVVTWTVYVTLVYLATYCERQIWVGANDHYGGWRLRGYTWDLVEGTEPVPYADWSLYAVDWRFGGEFGRWILDTLHGIFYPRNAGKLGGVEYLSDDGGGGRAWFSRAASIWG
ncbi:hypothetical protein QBC38DRAFT_190698 [Podospora fimiseda]|uniref:Uncharacterized protein n=1 Tax=Podospora fimiseda TaxID=252190 RepID=A0AAN7BQD2_9PEZI|nr:hypothetical protein QBC38DRAFT_190698 [Podospora fimiseda]